MRQEIARVSTYLAGAVVLTIAAAVVATVLERRTPSTVPRPGSSVAVGGVATAEVPRRLTASEQLTLQHAEDELTRQCMSRRGFEYWITATVPPPLEQLFPYVIDDSGWAKANGYQSSRHALVSQVQRANPNAHYIASLTGPERDRYVLALNGAAGGARGLVLTLPSGAVIGHSREGCTAEAEEALYGDFPRWWTARTLTLSVEAEWVSTVVADRRFATTVAKWSDCMAGRGYRYAAPANARRSYASRTNVRTAPDEIETAVAEAECAVQTGLAKLAVLLDGDAVRGLRPEQRTSVITYRRMALDALARAGRMSAGT